jgi:membrane protease YdiL (CAAX protease family)
MGLVLALLREWRGSLIAPMTMHALHNGTITLVSVLYLAAID